MECQASRGESLLESVIPQKCENSFSFRNTVLQVRWNPEVEEIIACTVEKDNVYIWNIGNEGGCARNESTVESMMSLRIVGHPDFLSWSPDGKYISVMNDVGCHCEFVILERSRVHYRRHHRQHHDSEE